MEYRGGTYLSQVTASGEREALLLWARNLVVSEVRGLGLKRKLELIAGIEQDLDADASLTAIRGLVNVWCADAATSGGFILVTITATAKPTTIPSRRHT